MILYFYDQFAQSDICSCVIRYEPETWPRSFRTLFMLNSAEHGIYPVHKYLLAEKIQHMKVLKQEEDRFQHLSFYEQLKVHVWWKLT